MAGAYKSISGTGFSSGTGDRGGVSIGTAAGDLLLCLVAVSENSNDSPTVTDREGGSWSRLGTWHGSWTSADADRVSLFIRNTLIQPAEAGTVVIDTQTGYNTSATVTLFSYTGFNVAGTDAVRQVATAGYGAAGAAPGCSFPGNVQTGNLTAMSVASADSTTTPPSGWTERREESASAPDVRAETATRDSGFSGATVTWGATQSTVWTAVGVELRIDLPPIDATLSVTLPTATVSSDTDVPIAAASAVTLAGATLAAEAGVLSGAACAVVLPEATLEATALVVDLLPRRVPVAALGRALGRGREKSRWPRPR